VIEIDGRNDYEFDVYTEINGDNAIGITHGYIQPIYEGESRRKKNRERDFPLERILNSTEICIQTATATNEADKEYILNSIGESIELNNVLRGIFVAPALERIVKERDIGTIASCLNIVKASNAKIIDLDFLGFTEFNNKKLNDLVNSLPSTLAQFTLHSERSAVDGNTINECLEKIIKCPQLVRLNLSYNNINADGAGILADVLKVNRSLQYLRLNDNNISTNGATKIADALKENECLVELELANNNIGCDETMKIAVALEVNKTLTTLELSANKICDEGAKALADSLIVNMTLKKLTINNNQIGNDGAMKIANASHRLERLSLKDNSIDNHVKERILKETTDANHRIQLEL
jgi:hypothetical protein